MDPKKEINNFFDPLNETIQGEIIPLAFSTEIKQRKKLQKKVDIEYSFDVTNSTFPSEALNDENEIEFKNPQVPLTLRDMLTNHKENENYISARYLEKHEKPLFISTNFVIEPNEKEEKVPLHETNIIQPNSQDISYFNRHSNTINDSQSRNQSQICVPIRKNIFTDKNFCTPKKYNLDMTLENRDYQHDDDTIQIIERAEAMDLNNTTVSSFNELLEDVDLSKSLDVTKFAFDLKKSESKKAERLQKDLLSKTVKITKDVILLSNKSYLLWIGVPVQKKEIKSFTLNLRSSLSQKVHVSLKGNSDCFYFTNQHGQNESKFVDVVFESKTDRKFYVTFHPTNSNYHTDMIVIIVGERKFKINLFGYADPAIVDLKGFQEVNDPTIPEKKVLMKYFIKSKGLNTFAVSVFNSGARTAFVSLKAYNNASMKIRPSMFLLIPKTKMEFEIDVIVGDDTFVKFLMFSADEELRRAARISTRDLPINIMYNIFNFIGIFTDLPEEKTIRQDDLPKFDWRPYLCRKVNETHRECCLTFSDDMCTAGSINGLPSESITTIGMVSKSSVNGRSVLANIECLEYMNTTESFVNSLQQSLSSVDILKDVNRFSPTYVNTSNYLGILIRNNNQFSVEWVVSSMTALSRDSLFEKNITEKSGGSSIYSLNSIPIYDPASSMVVLCKEGSLQINESVVIPIRFTPENTGKTACRCTVKVFSSNGDEASMEKDLEFIAEAFRKDQCNFYHSEIPYFKVKNSFEVSYRLSELKNDKYQIKIAMKKYSSHSFQIIASRLRAPFDLRITTVTMLEKRNMLCVNFKAPGKGVFSDVLVLSDQDGNSTFITLTVHVK